MESTDKTSEVAASPCQNTCDKHGICPNCKHRSDKKLNVYDWLEDIPESHDDTEFIEVQFKNTRKGYYRNSNKLKLEKGDIVAVESTPGHDIGEVTLTGRLVLIQMRKNNIRLDNPDIKRVYRKAKPNDIEKYEEAKAREHDTMLRARKIAEDLHLNMKIGDVEYQGDGNKAIFYYIADDRVDFRQLIKVLADAFHVRIEMKQIGARQEAGRIGGIGPCGRELCCSGWMTSFVSVATSAARYQDISLNPQKLAGQCAKLKCCLNYEVDTYVEAQKQLPSREAVLQTKDAEYYHFKTDIHKRQLSYSTSKDFAANIVSIPASRVFEIIALNKRGIRVDSLEGENKPEAPKKEFSDVVGQDSLTRFDKSKKARNNNNNRNRVKSPRRDNQDETTQRDNGEQTQAQGSGENRDARDNRPQRRDRRDNREPRQDREPRQEREPRSDRQRQFRKDNRPQRQQGEQNTDSDNNTTSQGERQPRPQNERQPRPQQNRQPRNDRGNQQQSERPRRDNNVRNEQKSQSNNDGETQQ